VNILNIGEDRADLVFRILFCSIFIGLGFEHMFSDELIQSMMPNWVVYPRLVSVVCGSVLLIGGFMICAGYKIHLAAAVLGLFLLITTVFVHAVGAMDLPKSLPYDWHWLWEVYQRSSIVKNLCLIGVCFWLLEHEPGKYSLDAYFKNKSS
jgi:uncharacterized membrane protein YphA (DoxX/SURF4 family)